MASKLKALGAVLLCGAMAAWGGDVEVYAGRDLGADEGVVVLRVERVSSADESESINRGDQLVAVVREVEGKRKVTIPDSDKSLAIVLPAGRWFVDELRTARERSLPRVMQKHQSFEVQAGKINYAGLYRVRFLTEAGGRASASTAIEYDPPLIEEATQAFPEAFAKLPLVYCPVGRLCKPPAEFKR